MFFFTESVGKGYRNFAGELILLAFPIAQCVLALTAYFIPSWKMLIIVSIVPYFPVLFGYVLIPVSIHWLRVQGKMDKLHATFKKIAERNKTKFPENVIIECYELILLEKVNPLKLFKRKSYSVQLAYKCTLGLAFFYCILNCHSVPKILKAQST